MLFFLLILILKVSSLNVTIDNNFQQAKNENSYNSFTEVFKNNPNEKEFIIHLNSSTQIGSEIFLDSSHVHIRFLCSYFENK